MKRIAASGNGYVGAMGITSTHRADWVADLVLVKGSFRTVVQAKRYKKRVDVRSKDRSFVERSK